MPKLIAAALEDGWAFVEDGEEVKSIKPPYNRCDALTISHAAIREAVQMYGFDIVDKGFDDWQALITFLETEMVRIRKAFGQNLPPDFAPCSGLPRERPFCDTWTELKSSCSPIANGLPL